MNASSDKLKCNILYVPFVIRGLSSSNSNPIPTEHNSFDRHDEISNGSLPIWELC